MFLSFLQQASFLDYKWMLTGMLVLLEARAWRLSEGNFLLFNIVSGVKGGSYDNLTTFINSLKCTPLLSSY